MPDVLPVEVDDLVHDGRERLAVRTDVVEARFDPVRSCLAAVGADGHHRVERAPAVRHSERECGNDRPNGHEGVFERTDPHRVLPAQFCGIRRDDDVVPRHPVDHLHVVQVEVQGVGVHTVVRDLPDLCSVDCRRYSCDVEAARHVRRIQHLGRGVDEGIQDDVLQQWCRPGGLQPHVRRHPAEFVELRRIHLVMDALRLQRYPDLGPREGVELEGVSALLVDPCVAVAACGRVGGGVAVAGADEAGAVGRVVGGLADDHGVLPRLEDAGAVSVVRERGHQGAHPVVRRVRTVERHIRSGIGHLDLHDRAGVGSVAGQGGRGAGGAQIGATGVVVIARHACREGGGGVVIQDQGLPPVGREVDDDVGPLGGREQQGVLVDIADVESRRVGDPCGRLSRDHHRGRQEAALGPDLDPVGPLGAQRLVRGREDDGVTLGGGELGLVQRHLAEGAGRRVGDIPGEVPEPVVGRVEDPVPVRPRVDRGGRVGRAVDDRGVVERLHSDRDVRSAGDESRLAERLDVGVTGSVVVGVGDRLVLGIRVRRPEPGAVHPATEGAHATRIAGVLGRHVDVRGPQAAFAAPLVGLPGRVDLGHRRRVRHEGLVLDDQRITESEARKRTGRADEALLHRIGDQVAGGLARVHVEARDAPGVIVVEHQARALLVGVEERLRTVARVGHVRHVAHAHALGVGRALARGGDPLVRRAVADPRGDATVEVQGGPVLREAGGRLRRPSAQGVANLVQHGRGVRRHVHRRAVRVQHHPVGAHAGAHQRGVHGQEEVTLLAGGQQVAELDPHRPVLLGDDCRAEVVGLVHAGDADDRRDRGGVEVRIAQRLSVARHHGGRQLDVAAQQGRGQVAVELHAVLHDTDLVVVGARVGRLVGDPDGDVLTEVVRLARTETGQGVDELLETGGQVPRAVLINGDGGDGAEHGDLGDGARALVEGRDAVGDGDRRDGAVTGPAVGDVDPADVDRRLDDGGVGEVLRGAVPDLDRRGMGVTGAGREQLDARDHTVGHRRRGGGLQAGLPGVRAVTGVGQSELDDRRNGVAGPTTGDLEVVDFAAGGRGGWGARAAAGEGHRGRGEAEARLGDGDAGDDAWRDGRVSRCQRDRRHPRRRDRHGRWGDVAGAGVGHRDRGDAARLGIHCGDGGCAVARIRGGHGGSEGVGAHLRRERVARVDSERHRGARHGGRVGRDGGAVAVEAGHGADIERDALAVEADDVALLHSDGGGQREGRHFAGRVGRCRHRQHTAVGDDGVLVGHRGVRTQHVGVEQVAGRRARRRRRLIEGLEGGHLAGGELGARQDDEDRGEDAGGRRGVGRCDTLNHRVPHVDRGCRYCLQRDDRVRQGLRAVCPVGIRSEVVRDLRGVGGREAHRLGWGRVRRGDDQPSHH